MASEVTYMRIGDLIILQDKVNSDNNEFPVLGLNKEKSFMPTVANVNDVNLQKYKVVEKGWFAFSGMQTGRDVCIRLARYTDDFPALISPAYTTFTLRDRVGEKEISPAYLFMFFNREESDRYGAFISDSSVRANLDWSRFCDIEIPVPDIEIQRQLVDVWEGLNGLKVDNDAQLNIGKKEGANLPKIFCVNWFRKTPEGKWLWPGYGDNSRILKWVFERCDGEGAAQETAIGYLPTIDAIDRTGTDVTEEDMQMLLTVDKAGWMTELETISEHFKKFDRLPAELEAQRQALAERLAK